MNTKILIPDTLKKLIIIITLISLSLFSFSTNNDDLAETDLYLITCSPGDMIHSHFGHTAIRLYNKTKGIDVIYNYGTFNFRDPNFLPKFVKGELNYRLEKNSFRRFCRAYKREKRDVIQQKLLISASTKQRLITILDINARPENRSFLYRFLDNNCTTKVIDQFKLINQDINEFSKLDSLANTTWRKELNKYLKFDPWLRFGIHLVLGSPLDKEITVSQKMFLPENCMKTITEEFDSKFLGEKEFIVKESVKFKVPWFSPKLTFWLLFCFIIFLIVKGKTKTFKVASTAIIFVTGVLGFLLLYMWFFTNHPSELNYNLLWANPLNLIFLLTSRKFKYRYAKNNTIILSLTLLLWWFIPQDLSTAIIPIIIINILYYINRRLN